MQKTYTLGPARFVLEQATAEAMLAATRAVCGRGTMTFNLVPLCYAWANGQYRTIVEQAFIADCLPVDGLGLSREEFTPYSDNIADRGSRTSAWSRWRRYAHTRCRGRRS